MTISRSPLSSLISINNVFDDFLSKIASNSFDSFDSFLDTLDYSIKYPNYPTTNIGILGNGTSVIEMAVTGFGKEDIQIEVEGNDLKVIGIFPEIPEEDQQEIKYFHKGLGKKSFNILFKISDKLDVDSIITKLENGLLEIRIPLKASAKPVKKKIEIL